MRDRDLTARYDGRFEVEDSDEWTAVMAEYNREADAITAALWAYQPRRRLAMKRYTLRGVCLAVCIGAGSTAWWLASPAGAQQGFSLKSLRGEYVYALDGYTIQGDTGQHQPFAWAGKETYDGAGHVAGVFTASYNGEIVHRTYTGTYTVNPDGTGSTLLTDSNGDVTHFDIFIREGSDEVSYVETDPGVVSSGYERRR